MKKFFLLGTLLFVTYQLQAQVIKGRLMDQITGQAIPYATFNLIGTNNYFISNEEGHFSYMIQKIAGTDSISIAALGYERKSVSIHSLTESKEVYLKQNIRILDEVTVHSGEEEDAEQIIKLAKKAIAKNFISVDSKIEGYFRMFQKIDSSYTFFLDASVNILGNSYSAKSSSVKSELIKANNIRISDDLNQKGYENWMDTLMQSSNWVSRLLARNDVKFRNYLLDKSARYTLHSYTMFNGRPCYEIKVEKKPWHYVSTQAPTYDGFIHLIIDREDYKIYRLKEYEKIEAEDYTAWSLWVKNANDTISTKIVGGSRIVEYRFFEEKLSLSMIRESNTVADVHSRTGNVLNTNYYQWEFYVNDTSIPDSEVLGNLESNKEYVSMSEFDLFNDDLYQEEFWNGYNKIPDGELTKRMFNDLGRRIDVKVQFKQKELQ